MNTETTDVRFYKTGDYVSVDADGTVHFLGRIDRQVKVNGYRVELEHVESVLRSLPDLADAAVFLLPISPTKTRLVAAILADTTDDVSARVREPLAALLPEYMIPACFVALTHFPRNDNGKTDLKALRELVLSRICSPERTALESQGSGEVIEGLRSEIRALWKRQFGERPFRDDESFFTLGGDSLDAIQLIAELQQRGFEVTARAFLLRPTVDGLVDAQQQVAASALQAPVDAEPRRETRSLSPAQHAFFRHVLAQSDHYNQAVLLASDSALDPVRLERAVAAVVARHPSLHMAYVEDEQGLLVLRQSEADTHGFGVTTIGAEVSDAGLSALVEQTAETLHRRTNLARGSIFHAHLFRHAAGKDMLLLVAHHVAVDVLSFRVIVADLVRAYVEPERKSGHAPRQDGFWRWSEHLEQQRDKLVAESEPWLSHTLALCAGAAPRHDDDNTEGRARTLWLGLSHHATQRLSRDSTELLGAPLHVALLAAFAHRYAEAHAQASLRVDVESHGRLSLDDAIDASSLVGWHTSTFPIRIDTQARSLTQAIASTAQELRDVPHLGHAYGVAAKSTTDYAVPASAVCFNYLGEIHFPRDERLPLSPAVHPIGHGRGADNNRLYELKLTGRIIAGQLVLDLSIPGRADIDLAASVLRHVRDDLLRALGEPASAAELVFEQGTRTGLLTFVPAALLERALAPTQRDYRAVLLTGATGYVGAHVLRELLVQTSARVHCLVRTKLGRSGEERLRDAFDHYFPDTPLSAYRERVAAVEADVASARFGMSEQTYAELAASVDAVYHFAAETKLFGREEEFHKTNVEPIHTCIEFVRTGRSKDLHYMSTLAVAGTVASSQPVEFCEDSTDVGQEFQNHYEATKLRAEKLVRTLSEHDRGWFIYRSGNVSGSSTQARFQRNAADNRFVQFLAACSKLGALPRELGEPIVLSPVDEVAASLVAISLDASVSSGVFHVDSPHATDLSEVFSALQRTGIPFTASEHRDFASLFSSASEHRDPLLALGSFWASRKPRNVRYNHERTLSLLARLGYSFTKPDADWLHKFVRSLVEAGALTSSARSAVEPQVCTRESHQLTEIV